VKVAKFKFIKAVAKKKQCKNETKKGKKK